MEWKLIDKKQLPENEILAGNFMSRTYGYKEKLLGYLHEEDGVIVCESDNETLDGVTHYIDIKKYDPP